MVPMGGGAIKKTPTVCQHLAKSLERGSGQVRVRRWAKNGFFESDWHLIQR